MSDFKKWRPPANEISSLKDTFEHELFENVIPFWQTHSPDPVNGGYFNCLNRDGSIYDTTKHVWLQGRQTWMFSKLYNKHEQRTDWLETAKSGIEFLQRHAVRNDKRLWFSLSSEGEPIWIQRKIFSECFYIIALAEYSRAANKPELLKDAKELFELVWNWSKDLSQFGPSALEGEMSPKKVARLRLLKGKDLLKKKQAPSKSLAMPMILLNVIEELTDGNPEQYRQEVDSCIQEISLFIHPDKQTVFETVGMEGQFLDTMEGRLLNPGHAIETGWFLHRWADILKDDSLRATAVNMIRWSHKRGWDPKHGGLFYFLDYKGHSPVQLEWFMKLWWPHNEALIGHLLNYTKTGDKQDWELFNQLREYTFEHFHDKEHGEWFGYLNQQGEVTHTFKGGPYKGFFHVPRSLWICYQLLEGLEKTTRDEPRT